MGYWKEKEEIGNLLKNKEKNELKVKCWFYIFDQQLYTEENEKKKSVCERVRERERKTERERKREKDRGRNRERQ